MKDLELFNIITQIRHMFGGEGIIWRVGEGSERCAKGVAEDSQDKTHGLERIRSLQFPWAGYEDRLLSRR